MRVSKLRRSVTAALFAALCCVMTLVLQYPSPLGGYFNLGDCMVLTCGYLLGPVFGPLAAGLGSCLADLFSGYPQYAPATLLIKAGMAAIVALLCRAFARSSHKAVALLVFGLAALLAEGLMILGYFAYEAVCLGYGAGAAVGLLSNLWQGIAGLVGAFVLSGVLARIPGIGRYFSGIDT